DVVDVLPVLLEQAVADRGVTSSLPVRVRVPIRWGLIVELHPDVIVHDDPGRRRDVLSHVRDLLLLPGGLGHVVQVLGGYLALVVVRVDITTSHRDRQHGNEQRTGHGAQRRRRRAQQVIQHESDVEGQKRQQRDYVELQHHTAPDQVEAVAGGQRGGDQEV